jgi:hypothetical protein
MAAREEDMPHVRYFRDGKEEGFTPWSGTLDSMKKIATVGLARHGLDRAEIVDETGSVLWWRAANGTEGSPVRGTLLQSALRAVGGIARRA